MGLSNCCKVATTIEHSWRHGEMLVCSFCYQPCREKETMDMKAFERFLEKIAPTLASHLHTPLGNMVLGVLACAYEVSNRFDLEDLHEQIRDSPAKAKELELEHREAVLGSLSDLYDKMQSGASNAPRMVLGVVFGLAFLGYVCWMIFNNAS